MSLLHETDPPCTITSPHPPPGASRCRTPPRPCRWRVPWCATPWPSWSSTADGDTAELLTAELVANAVEHTSGRTPIELVVELAG
ncbi:hypothetical protein SVIOM342S_06108 [Streptomyces violaceorubidus]